MVSVTNLANFSADSLILICLAVFVSRSTSFCLSFAVISESAPAASYTKLTIETVPRKREKTSTVTFLLASAKCSAIKDKDWIASFATATEKFSPEDCRFSCTISSPISSSVKCERSPLSCNRIQMQYNPPNFNTVVSFSFIRVKIRV